MAFTILVIAQGEYTSTITTDPVRQPGTHRVYVTIAANEDSYANMDIHNVAEAPFSK